MPTREIFPDGWPYAPDESVHSPAQVDELIRRGDLLPPECLDGDYRTDPETMEEALSKAVYGGDSLSLLATVAHHRLRYVMTAFTDEFAGAASEVASWDVLRAVSSLYGQSPHPGEIEVFIRRVTDGGTIDIASETVVGFWTDHVAEMLDDPDVEEIEDWVRADLEDAGVRHGRMLSTGGSLGRQWHEAAGERVPKPLVNDIRLVLAENVRVCDTTRPRSSSSVPGLDTLTWTDWTGPDAPTSRLSDLGKITAPVNGD